MANNKEEFLRKFNQAFVKNDIDFIVDNITDDVEWNMVGMETTQSKAAVESSFKKMENDFNVSEINIENIITHGKNASVNGIMKMKEKDKIKNYGFCDVYTFSGFKNPKIKKLNSYIISLDK